MGEIIKNNAFWTIIGIILGSVINHVFWLLQSKKHEKLITRGERHKKIEEICDFLNILDEKMKVVYGVSITGNVINHFNEVKNFWADLKIIKIRTDIQIYFGKCIKEYDELQISISSYMGIVHKLMRNEIVTNGEFDQKYFEISERRNILINTLIKRYSDVICL